MQVYYNDYAIKRPNYVYVVSRHMIKYATMCLRPHHLSVQAHDADPYDEFVRQDESTVSNEKCMSADANHLLISESFALHIFDEMICLYIGPEGKLDCYFPQLWCCVSSRGLTGGPLGRGRILR